MDDKTAQNIRDAIDKRMDGAASTWPITMGVGLYQAFKDRGWIVERDGADFYRGKWPVGVSASVATTDWRI